jgi:hypothetical protein
MFDHTNCSHPHSKVARAACRREHQAALDDSVRRHPANGKKQPRGQRLPSMIAPKLRPIIDHAKEKGLKIRLVTDAPEGVDQAFVILNPKRANCQLIIEAFQAASKGREGRAEFYHVEDGKSRQLSTQRAMADIDTLAS